MDDGQVTDQWLGAPVQGDEGEQLVLDATRRSVRWTRRERTGRLLRREPDFKLDDYVRRYSRLYRDPNIVAPYIDGLRKAWLEQPKSAAGGSAADG